MSCFISVLFPFDMGRCEGNCSMSLEEDGGVNGDVGLF